MGKWIDITGNKYGRLTVICFDRKEVVNISLKYYWRCVCECGKELITRSDALRAGKSKSCGCIQREHAKNLGHKNIKHGKAHTSEYCTWSGAISRCTNPNNGKYFNYGMRGISVCERWLHSFENFISDMGKKPSSKHTLDRINNDGNYEPKNCRWATVREQSRNTRSNHWIEYNGKRLIIADWERELGLCKSTINEYLKRGHTDQETISYYLNKKLAKCK